LSTLKIQEGLMIEEISILFL